MCVYVCVCVCVCMYVCVSTLSRQVNIVVNEGRLDGGWRGDDGVVRAIDKRL